MLNWVQGMHGLRMFDRPNVKKCYDALHSHLTQASIMQVASVPTLDTDTFYTCRQAVDIIKDRTKGYTL